MKLHFRTVRILRLIHLNDGNKLDRTALIIKKSSRQERAIFIKKHPPSTDNAEKYGWLQTHFEQILDA